MINYLYQLILSQFRETIATGELLVCSSAPVSVYDQISEVSTKVI